MLLIVCFSPDHSMHIYISFLFLLLLHHLIFCDILSPAPFSLSTPCCPMALQIEASYIPLCCCICLCLCLFHCHRHSLFFNFDCHCNMRAAISLIVCPRNQSKLSPSPHFYNSLVALQLDSSKLLLQHPLALWKS